MSKCHESHCHEECNEKQRHVHEFLGSSKLAELEDNTHNHRFAGITGEAKKRGDSHVHETETNTDFFEDHFHEIKRTTGPVIPIGNGKHIHFVTARITLVDSHRHEFQFATLIENSIG